MNNNIVKNSSPACATACASGKNIVNKSLVVWGNNFGLNYGKLSSHDAILRNMYKIPSFQLSIFIGLLLSDAGFVGPSKKNITKNTNYAIQLGAKFENLNFILDTFFKLAL